MQRYDILEGDEKMLEIIAETLEDARAIEKGGADRIELVSSLSEGGLTPSYGMVKAVLDEIRIPVNVMIRPHSRSFTYTKEDIQVMKEDARIFNEMGVRQVVIGILDQDGLPNLSALDEVLKDTRFTVTFHRAIDESVDVMESLDRLKDHKRVTHILTSGGAGKAEDHLDVLKEMIKTSKNQKIIVASGINQANLRAIQNELCFEGQGGNGERVFDLHAGTAVRNQRVDQPVLLDQVEKMVEIYQHDGKKGKW